MTTIDPRLTLLLRHIHTSDIDALVRGARCLCDELLCAGVWTLPLMFRAKGRPDSWATLGSIDDLAGDLAHSAVDGLVLTDRAGRGCEVELYARDELVSLHCSIPMGINVPADVLDFLVGVGTKLWQRLAVAGPIGPTFAIRPLGIDYPRPSPPAISTRWSLGDAAYFIDQAFHEKSAIGDPEGIRRLCNARLPDGVARQQHDGLTVLRCAGPVNDSSVLANQLFVLERWMSSTLNLPLDPDFKENGDRRVRLLKKTLAAPFTFYDVVLRTAYKAVATAESESMSAEERAELAEALQAKVLQNGRKVRAVMVIFSTREAAIRNQEVVAKLGASGVVYVDDDHQLWNPDPPGN